MADYPTPTELIPHRAPFLFVDEILGVTETEVVAQRTFRTDDFFLEGHFPDDPIVPGVILLEGMAQTFAYYMATREPGSRGVLTGVDRAHFRRPVRPGETVEYRVVFDGHRHGLVRCSATAWVGEAKVADAKLSGGSPVRR